MSRLEKQMVDLLSRMRDDFNVVGVKAEFEAEETRLEEARRSRRSRAARLHTVFRTFGV